MSKAITAFEKDLTPKFKRLIEDIRNATGTESAKKLKTKLKARHASIRSMGFRAAAPSIASFAFDKSNPKAVQWVEEHATETIDDLSATTREDIKNLIEQSMQGNFDVDTLADDIAELIGDPERAELIARTETMQASNEGQQEAWDQAVEDGLLTGNEEQEWIVTPDDRLCPECEPFDGVTAELGGTFEAGGEESDGPPLHPRCRCTLGLKLGN